MIPQVGPAAPRPESARSGSTERHDDGEPFRLPSERPQDTARREGGDERRGRPQQAEERVAREGAASRRAQEPASQSRASGQALDARALERRAGEEPDVEEAGARERDERQDEEALRLDVAVGHQLQAALAALAGMGRPAEAPVEAREPQDPVIRGQRAPEHRLQRAQVTQRAAQQPARAPEAPQDAEGAAGDAEDGAPVTKADQKALEERLAQAARVEQALRVAHRPLLQVAQGLAGELAEAVRRALRSLSGDAVPDVAQVGAPAGADAAAFAALLASRAEGTPVLSARAATTMATPAQAAQDAAFMLSDAPDGGMVVRLAGEAGQLEIRVQLEGKQVVVRVRADDPAAQQRLQEALPELKRALEKLPEVAAHGGHVDVRDETPGRRGQGGGQRRQAEDDADMAEVMEAAMAGPDAATRATKGAATR